jgi:hypothetical protein
VAAEGNRAGAIFGGRGAAPGTAAGGGAAAPTPSPAPFAALFAAPGSVAAEDDRAGSISGGQGAAPVTYAGWGTGPVPDPFAARGPLPLKATVWARFLATGGLLQALLRAEGCI